jgi:alpha-N-arabinofuranosidase
MSLRPLLVIVLLAVSEGHASTEPAARPAPAAVFDWFEYTGRDRRTDAPLAAGAYRNPILGGFYPDPSLCRVGPDYYLVNSSFAYFPGVPLFHSQDLVHWSQVGHVLTRPSQLKLDGLQVSQGIFAPSLRYHAGTFYMITTLVGGGGNFYVTAKDPAGPWSDPIWLPEIDGIDPSFFFDEDDRAYVVNNGPPADGHGLYSGHRALWMQEFDLRSGRLTGPREIIVDGGVDISKHPIWIEGPHLFRRNGWYTLIAAEGGTGEDHSEVVFRSRQVRGPYVPWDQNPILTQRTLDPARPDPVTSTGHADFVETPDGAWWAVFLGARPYAYGRLYNTGRETFLLPVTWKDDWPRILPPGTAVPATAAGPMLPAGRVPQTPLGGDFTWRDEFDGPTLDPRWNLLRTPHEAWYSLTDHPGALSLQPGAGLSGRDNPSFVGRRQQHLRFTAETSLRMPTEAGYSAGLVAFQNETHFFYLGVRRKGKDAEVFLERTAGSEPGAVPATVARLAIAAPLSRAVELRIEASGRTYAFSYATRPGAWTTLKEDEDGSILSTAVAGGFVGTYIGLHARTDP